MMLAAEELKVVPATVHIPLAAVPRALTRALLAETIRITAAALRSDFGIAAPRIAVAGLNPHAGEGGLIGARGDGRDRARRRRARRRGPRRHRPASRPTRCFMPRRARTYDAAIAMYHDQALIPIKTLAFDRGVNVTLGLPFVRTSPDHGTAFALAGTGKARPAASSPRCASPRDIGRRRAAASRPARP